MDTITINMDPDSKARNWALLKQFPADERIMVASFVVSITGERSADDRDQIFRQLVQNAIGKSPEGRLNYLVRIRQNIDHDRLLDRDLQPTTHFILAHIRKALSDVVY
jgi:hypothetical protein